MKISPIDGFLVDTDNKQFVFDLVKHSISFKVLSDQKGVGVEVTLFDDERKKIEQCKYLIPNWVIVKLIGFFSMK